VNTLAGGGSLLTVPLLVVLGLPGTLANGTNRIGVFVMSVVAAWRFRAEGVSGFRESLPVLLPVTIGSVIGAGLISQATDETFEVAFGVAMLLLLYPILRGGPLLARAGGREHRWSRALALLLLLVIGLYGGAIQAGIGIFLVVALSGTGYDLVRANAIKVVVNAVQVFVVLPVFIAQHQVVWLPALVLAAGFALGGEVGARLAIQRGERIIRPVLAACTVILAGKMLGLY
jgi:uncharacterized membrane protein YfcA